jgi:hypothetical protein
LFEGDGHISFAPQYIPRWHITAHKKNLPFIEHLHSFIGFGFIRHKTQDKAEVLTIGNSDGLLKIVELLNGRLYTPKITEFHMLIDWLNTHKELNIQKLSLKKDNLNNAWFSGFSDADSNFYLRTTTGKKERFAATFRIDQRIVDPHGESYEPIMTLIANEFKGSLNVVQKANGKSYFHLNCNTSESLDLLINYFEKYPLLSSKFLDYECWKDAITIKRNNKPLADTDKKNIIILKNQMNNNRKIFSWQHLRNIPVL